MLNNNHQSFLLNNNHQSFLLNNNYQSFLSVSPGVIVQRLERSTVLARPTKTLSDIREGDLDALGPVP
jgi:hypothetical protein